MDRYFYSVEEIDGNKVVHMSGNVYCNDENGAGEKDYRVDANTICGDYWFDR